MVSGSFVGLLDSTYTSTPENKQPLRLVDETSILTLDDVPLRMGSDLVYDSETDRVIFFGGATENLQPVYDDTWSFDYETNEWTNMEPLINPPSTEWHQIAYHSGQDKVILFGGHDTGVGSSWLNHNETWMYDYNTNTWTDLDPVLAPPAFSGGTMAYDSESDLMILFGDWPDGGAFVDFISETWTYNLTSNNWTNVTTSVQPSARSWSSMTYDVESDSMVLFG
ncbi:MAG: Kelch repeat-containing protein [Candidatus Thorarchaeota archaeon]